MSTNGLREYRQMSARSAVESATPHRLIQLLMERALLKIGAARLHMERGNVSEKGSHIGDALAIVGALRASLNHKADPQLAGNFEALYDYMERRLLHANLKNDPALLDEVAGLLRELKEAWDAIADRVGDADGRAVAGAA